MSANTRRFRFGWTLALAVLATVVTSQGTTAQTVTPATKALISGLKSGNWAKRTAAAANLQREPYSEAVVAVVLPQVEKLQRKPERALAEKPKKVSAEDASAYYHDLVSYLAKGGEASMIPVLIKDLNVGREVVESLARRGETAAPAVIAAARASTDSTHTSAALHTLRLMIERRVMLSQPSRSGMTEVVIERLRGKQASLVVMDAIAVAAVMDDPRARKRLGEIAGAQSSGDAGLTFSDPDNALRIRPAAEAALAVTPEQQIAINSLRSPDWLRRYDASRVVLNMAAKDRSTELNAAVIQELQRLQKSPSLGAELVPASVQDRSMGLTYYRNLIDVASDAPAPAVIPILVKAVSMGEPVVRGLARFEDAAVSPLVEAIRQGAGPEDAQSSLTSLRRILDRKPDVAPSSRTGMLDATFQCLKGKQTSSVVLRALDLARGLRAGEVAQGLTDTALEVRLTAIAHAASGQDVDLVLTDPEHFARVQAAAKLALGIK